MGQLLQVIEEKRERPFHCGSQHLDWENSNCCRCTKRIDDEADATQFKCDLQKALFDSMWGDGTISEEIARRLGYDGAPTTYNWRCAEVEWTEEWKAEYRRRHTLRYRAQRRWHTLKRAVTKWARDKIRKSRERWRMPIAQQHLKAGTTGCWANWCTWAMDMSEKPTCDDSGQCKWDAEQRGSCWCGKYIFESPTQNRAKISLETP